MLVRVASFIFVFSLSSFSLGYSGFPCPKGVREDPWGEVLTIHRTVIWNFLPLCVRHASSLFSFRSKLKAHFFSSCRFFLLIFTNPTTSMRVSVARVCVCVRVCLRVACAWVCIITINYTNHPNQTSSHLKQDE